MADTWLRRRLMSLMMVWRWSWRDGCIGVRTSEALQATMASTLGLASNLHPLMARWRFTLQLYIGTLQPNIKSCSASSVSLHGVYGTYYHQRAHWRYRNAGHLLGVEYDGVPVDHLQLSSTNYGLGHSIHGLLTWIKMPANVLDGRRKNGVTKHSRVRSGCLVCRQRRKKCDERRPQCQKCERMGLACSWPSSYVFRVTGPGLSETSDRTIERMESRERAGGSSSHEPSYSALQAAQSSSSQISTRSSVQNQEQSLGSIANAASEIERSPTGNLSGEVNETAPSQPPLNDFAAMDGISEGWLQQISDKCSWSPLEPILSQSPDAYNVYYPNAEYRALHRTLYNYMVDTAQAGNAVQVNPESTPQDTSFLSTPRASSNNLRNRFPTSATNLTARREQELWVNYLDEVTDWLDMFDNENHFKTAISVMAQTSHHLKLAVLALSSRQLERRDPSKPYVESLGLYSEAIQLINKDLPSMSIAVIASCVLLCVLEMMSSSPNEWARHLDGCAMLITAAGIHGAVGGMKQAIFWCFARME